MRPRPTVRHPAALAATALGLALALAGCAASGQPPAQGSPASAGSTTADAPPGATASSPAPSRTFAVLPESVLTPLPPLTYTTPAGAEAEMVAQGAQPAVNAVFRGGISREFVYQGTTVGGVELYRFDPVVPPSTRETFVPLMVQSFARVAPTPGTLGSTKVQVADGARGTALSVVGWTKGDDVILVWAQGVPATEQIAAQYIAQTR